MELNRAAIFNDDYCDLQDGSDETETSACSYLKVEYRCTSVYSIPTSRINDGVCDCCDGSDEVGSPFQPHCLNLCSAVANTNDPILTAHVAKKKKNESTPLSTFIHTAESNKQGSLRRPDTPKLQRSKHLLFGRRKTVQPNPNRVHPTSTNIIVLIIAIVAFVSLLFILKYMNLFISRLWYWSNLRCSSLYWYGNNVLRTLHYRLCHHRNQGRKSHSV